MIVTEEQMVKELNEIDAALSKNFDSKQKKVVAVLVTHAGEILKASTSIIVVKDEKYTPIGNPSYEVLESKIVAVPQDKAIGWEDE